MSSLECLRILQQHQGRFVRVGSVFGAHPTPWVNYREAMHLMARGLAELDTRYAQETRVTITQRGVEYLTLLDGGQDDIGS